ncbi:hypothetical protein [Streptomyces sp. NBC_00203]
MVQADKEEVEGLGLLKPNAKGHKGAADHVSAAILGALGVS